MDAQATEQTIAEILECAVNWISADADRPDAPPEEWQRVMVLLRAAPLLQQACEGACDAFDSLADRDALTDADAQRWNTCLAALEVAKAEPK